MLGFGSKSIKQITTRIFVSFGLTKKWDSVELSYAKNST